MNEFIAAEPALWNEDIGELDRSATGDTLGAMRESIGGPAAVLWDMDGTLVDTEPYWIEAEIELSARDGGTWTHEDGLSLVGSNLTDAAEVLRSEAGIVGTDEEIIEDLIGGVILRISARGLPWRPGAAELLAEVRAAGIPCALVTMSYASLADVVIAQLPVGTFDHVITGESVTLGKPHPEPYLLAASLLGVDPTRCVAIEDSHAGVASAEAAGTRVIAVPFMVPIGPAPQRSRVSGLDRVSLADLHRVVAGEMIELLA
jgi:HAD superfamily hydrolase (TIGR01509 family)